MTPTVKLQHPEKFYIDGQWSSPSSSAIFTVLNCATEEPFLHVAEAQREDIERAVAAARRAFDEGPWPQLTPHERADYLLGLSAEIDARSQDTAVALACEVGTIFPMAQMMAHMPGATYAKTAGFAEHFPFEQKRAGDAGAGLLVHEPVGVVAAIVPWNGPAIGIANKVSAALLCGCTVIVKVSPEAPSAGWVLAEACEKVGLPAGVINVVAADREVSESLVRNPGVDMVAFTGSTAAGKRIASICGERIARYQLELGGKSPAIILDDFDLGAAAQTLANSARFQTGQVCASLTRFIVTQKRHDDFVEALTAAFGSTRVGDPFAEGTEMGPLATSRHRQRVENYIAMGRAEGARLTTGGGRPEGLDRGWFVEPTVFANVDNNSTISREEVFGPVLSVTPARDEADAVRIANDTDYGLNAAVFTNDTDRAYAIARQIRSGTVGHNAGRIDLSIGFGGFKQSGIGREGGIDGLASYLERKTVLLNNYPSHLSN